MQKKCLQTKKNAFRQKKAFRQIKMPLDKKRTAGDGNVNITLSLETGKSSYLINDRY